MDVVQIILGIGLVIVLCFLLPLGIERRFGGKAACLTSALVAIVCIICGVVNINRSQELETFIEVPAYVSDVSSDTRMRSRGAQTYWDYTIHWERDGEEHTITWYDQLHKPNLDLKKVWINQDNTDISEDPPGVVGGLGIGVILGAVIAICLTCYKFSRLQRAVPEIDWESISCYSLAFVIVSVIGMVISGIVVYNASGRSYDAGLACLICFSIAFAISLVVAIISGIIDHKNTKEERKRIEKELEQECDQIVKECLENGQDVQEALDKWYKDKLNQCPSPLRK